MIFFMGSLYEILCICTCVTHRNTIERSYVDREIAPDNHLNDTQIYNYTIFDTILKIHHP